MTLNSHLFETYHTDSIYLFMVSNYTEKNNNFRKRHNYAPNYNLNNPNFIINIFIANLGGLIIIDKINFFIHVDTMLKHLNII